MHTLPLLLTSALLLLPHLTTADYIQSVCYPAVTPAPPCQAIIDIQTACTPNDTSPLGLLAHAECMCNGSFFPDWLGCLACLHVHGNRSDAAVSAFETIISSASVALCTGTPTADFADIFNGISNTEGGAQAGGTGLSDLYPGKTDVSLYFTASGPQGEGAITGSATLATRTADGAAATTGAANSVTGTGGSASTTGGSGSGSGSGGSSSSASAAVSSSKSAGGAAATQIVGGLMAVVLGGVMVAL